MKKVRIELQGISKSYYSETAVTQALRRVSLSFAMGEFVAITGESGSGKSTLLNIIGGMDSFDEGEMIVDGEPTFQYDDEDWETYRRTKIGYVFQDYSLTGHYTALDNVVSALLIMGQDPEEARKTAADYLKQVGLEEYGTHRASELSSGQKQRLSIARALAKNTGIIVADEPTGNLDSETGQQIIRLLQELSKDRLVIMVTHNYDQAEAYVTRKIRLHDGQIISDVTAETEDAVPDPAPDPAAPAEDTGTEKKPGRKSLTSNQVASIFARWNQRTQRGRAILFTSFLLVIAAASFLFIGELFVYRDDTTTKNYTQAGFYHEDDKRIVVKRQDGKDITDEDVKKLSSVRYVETVDSCDIANDINFYIEEGKDYEYAFGNEAKRSRYGKGAGEGEIKRVSFLNEKRFMMSTDAISEADLAYGRLPQARNEIVLYGADDSLLEKTMPCYFVFHNVWAENHYYQTNVTVTGILKNPTGQVYFSRELCRMLSMSLTDNSVFRIIYGDRIRHEITPVMSDSLTGNEVRLSSTMAEEYLLAGEFPCTIEEYDPAGKPTGKVVTDTVYIKDPHSADGLHSSTPNLLEVSGEFYNQHFRLTSSQASVYISSYAKTDQVLKKLDQLGYEGMSSYRISTIDYNEERTTQRLTIIGISALGLVILLLAEVLILRSLMKIRIKDYFVLKFIGMKMQVIRRISYFEMLTYTAVSAAITIALMWVLRLCGIPAIQEIMWYYEISSYALFLLYNFLLTLLTVLFFNRLLKGRLNA